MSLKIDRVELEIVIKNDESRKRMRELDDEMRKLRKELKGLPEDSQKFLDKSKRLKEVQSEYDRLTNKIGLAGLSLKELQRRQSELNGILRNLPGNSPLYDQYKKQLDEVNARIKELRFGAQSCGVSLKKMATGFNKYFGMLTVGIASVIAFARGITSAMKIITEFEQANANLATILGTNRKNISELTNNAKQLGSTTEWTAAKVTELQTELAKLGFSQNEILNATKPILGFATALQANLADAAEVSGAALRAFGLNANETERVVSAMTVAANKSALSFEYIKTSMAIVAPVAKAFNFNIEDTLALLGTLSDAGFDASSAATATRNILLNLANSSGKLAKALGNPIKSLDDLVPALIQLRDSGVDLNETLELTDKRSVAAFNRFLDGAESISKLRSELNNTEGELDRIREEQLNTTEGSIKMLNSAWEGLMLSFSNSAGPFKTVIDWLTKLINKLTEARTIGNQMQYGSDNYSKNYDFQVEAVKKYTKSISDLFEKNSKATEENRYSVQKLYEIQDKGLRDRLENQKKNLDLFEKEHYMNVENEKDKTRIWNTMSDAQKNEHRAITANINKLNEQRKVLDEVRQSYANVENTTTTIIKKTGGNGDDEKSSKQKKRLNDAMEKLETEHLKKMAEIKQQYINGDIQTELDYNQKMLEQQNEYDQNRKEELTKLLKTITDPSIRIDIANKIAEIESKNLDDLIKKTAFRETTIAKLTEKYQKQAAKTDEQKKVEEIKALDKAWGEKIEKTEQYYQILQAIEDKYDPEKKENLKRAKQILADNPAETNKKKDIKSQLNDDNLSSSEKDNLIDSSEKAELAQLDALQSLHDAEIDEILNYEEQRLLIEQKYKDLRETNDKEEFKRKVQLAQFAIEQMTTLLSAYSDYVNASQQAEEAAVEAKYDKQIKAAGKNTKKIEKLEAEKEKELRKVRAEGEEKSFKIQIAQALASTAMAAINAYSSAAAIPIVGTVLAPIAAGVALAAGMMQVATINKQHEAAKAGYKTGGYTGGTDRNEIRGYFPDGSPYHGKEFVANADATGNPEVRKFLDIFDVAQKRGTIRMLNTTQILEKVKLNGGFKSGGYVSETSDSSFSKQPVIALADVMALIDQRDNAFYSKLMQRLDDPIETYTIVSGRNGSYEKIKEYERLLNNARRSD
jgi:TP901 family phage tail tape measure protein